MIDFYNEIFSDVSKLLKAEINGITVVGEYVSSPTKFPTATIDEVDNRPVNRDSAKTEKYSSVVYRTQVFCNGDGKRALARKIFGIIAQRFAELNFTRKSYTTTPDVYNSSVYQITATFGAVIGEDGTIYKEV
jgi:hypothetical protein